MAFFSYIHPKMNKLLFKNILQTDKDSYQNHLTVGTKQYSGSKSRTQTLNEFFSAVRPPQSTNYRQNFLSEKQLPRLHASEQSYTVQLHRADTKRKITNRKTQCALLVSLGMLYPHIVAIKSGQKRNTRTSNNMTRSTP